MKLYSKILAITLLFPMTIWATNPRLGGKYTKDKKIHKEFSVSATATLKVDNSYGNIDVVTWNENRIVIDVHLITNGNNEDKVKDRLDKLDVEFTANNTMVSAITKFGDRKNSSWNFWGSNNNSNVKIEVNYTIKMPMSNNVELSNDYGTINLNKLDGVAKINCDYGQINIGQLNAANNLLSFDYTKNSTIGFMKSGKISSDYSSFTLEKTEKLELSADYTNSEIWEVDDLSYNNDYGKITVRNVGKLMGRGDYIPLHVEKVSGSLNVNTDYGSVTVEKLLPSVKSVEINSDYAGIKIGYDANMSFDFEIDLSYASFKGEDDLEIMHSNKDNFNKSYSGYHKSKASGNTIKINSQYGGVTFNKQ